jgi:aryl-alcohol dehydrogenase-like predicted oxidoreductase
VAPPGTSKKRWWPPALIERVAQARRWYRSVWERSARAKAVATVRAAVDAGITMLDVARAVVRGKRSCSSARLGGAVPDGTLISTKVELLGDAPEALELKLADSLRATMQRLDVERTDLLLLHSQLQPDDGPRSSDSGPGRGRWMGTD